jgi:DNA polymerase-3 subunit alpha
LKKLKEELGIEERDKEKRLELFNLAKEKIFYKEQEEKNIRTLEKTIIEFKDKYLQEEDMWEFDTLSMFITNDPFERYNSTIRPIEDVKENQEGIILGVITDITKKTNKNKQRFAYISVYNNGTIIELNCWNKQFEKYEDLLKKSSTLAIKVKKKDNGLSVVAIKHFNVWKNEKIIS